MKLTEIKMEWGTLLKIYEKENENESIGSVEIVPEMGYNFIENVFLNQNHRSKGYLRKIVDYLKSSGPLVCLPLPEHVEKFKHLGFKYHKSCGDDNYYILA